MEVTKKVAVMMPFGGDNIVHQRRCILDFMRIRYLVEQSIDVTAKRTMEKMNYTLEAFNAGVGYITPGGLRLIAEADILIGLVTEVNVNVIYELAVRNLLKDEMLLIVQGSPEELLPVYLRDMAHIRYDPAGSEAVINQINALSVAPEPPLRWADDIHPDLKRAIDTHDQTLQTNLQNTLHLIEHNCPKRPDFILDLVKDLDPGKILSNWDAFYRYGVVRIKWKKRSGGDTYLPEDMEGKPVFYDANERFFELFNYAKKKLPNPDGDDALTVEKLLNRIKRRGVVDGNDYEELIKDQERLSQEILFDDGFARAAVPVRFNGNHRSLPNRAYFPTLVAKRTVGDTRRHHTTYLLIVYIPEHHENPFDHPNRTQAP